MTNFFQMQLQDSHKKSVFFSLIRKARRQEIEKKKASLKWEDHKIYPSSLRSFSQCPKEFVASLANPTTIEDLSAIYLVKRGSAVHKEFQDSLLLSDKLYPKPTNIANKRILTKLEKNWPEVPYHSDITHHSGSADGVILYKGFPCVIEIKTTSKDMAKWESMEGPDEAHIMQVCDYMYHLTEMNYYGQPVKTAFICYLHLMYKPGDQDAEKEFKVPYDAYKERYEAYIKEETRQLNLVIDGSEGECYYQFCKKHGAKNLDSNNKKI